MAGQVTVFSTFSNGIGSGLSIASGSLEMGKTLADPNSNTKTTAKVSSAVSVVGAGGRIFQ